MAFIVRDGVRWVEGRAVEMKVARRAVTGIGVEGEEGVESLVPFVDGDIVVGWLRFAGNVSKYGMGGWRL